MTGKEIFKEHFFRIRYDFLDDTQQIKEESSVGYSCVKNGLLYSSLEEAENKSYEFNWLKTICTKWLTHFSKKSVPYRK